MENDYKNEIDYGDKMTILNSVSVRDFPHRCVGVIYAQLGKQLLIGTGFLLASNLVLTVAHNLYSREHQCFLSNLVFYPGVSGDHNRKNGLKVIDQRLPQEYISNKGIDPIKYDYALLKLEGNVEGAEFLELGGNYKERKEDVGVIGYRAASCSDNTAHQSCLWKSNAHSVQSNGEVLRHQLSTLGGNSGSPILVKRGKKGERHAVIAIHKGAPGEKAAFNEARIITDDLILNVLAWEKEMADSRIRFSLMLDSDQETVQTEAAKWLQDKKLKLAVIASQLQQPKPTQLEKLLQIKKKYLNEIVEQLESIPEGEKKQITSLTLKLTVYRPPPSSAAYWGHAAKQLAKLLPQLPALTSFNFYFRFQLIDHPSFTMLKESLKNVPNIRLIIDPQQQQHQWQQHWAKEWQSGKDPRRSVEYSAWDWK